MFEAFLRQGAFSAGWQQWVHLWELIVLVCRFLWNLLKLLAGLG